MSIARHFKSFLFLVVIGGLVVGVMLAQRGAKIDLGTIGGVKLVLAAPVTTPTSVVPAGLFAPGTQGTNGQPATGAQAFGRGTTGTVQKVDGQTISITAQDGTAAKATVNASTTYVKNGTMTVADLKVGDTVTVIGQTAADGVVTATQVAVGGAGQAAAALGAGGAGRQGGAGATGAGGQLANVSIVTGSVKKIDGNTVSVAVEGGQAKTVTIGANARMSKSAPATLADVASGATVTIIGQTGADGTIAATAVQIGAAR